MQYCAYCILSAPSALVGKLVWVQYWWEAFLKVFQDQSPKALHSIQCEWYGTVVIQACWGGVFRHWHKGCGLKACWHSFRRGQQPCVCLSGGSAKKKKKWTVRIYRLYRRQCAKYTYIYSVHTVYYKDIVINTHTPYVHIYIMYTSIHSNMWRCNRL